MVTAGPHGVEGSFRERIRKGALRFHSLKALRQ